MIHQLLLLEFIKAILKQLNIIYFGEGCYGIKEASYHYYGVSPRDLTSEQITALVWTIKSPNNYNPNAIPAMTGI